MPARTKRDALCYLRRSTSKQEMGIHGQLEWALQSAREHDVNLEACPDDIGEMLQRGLKSYRGIFLDDGISGSRLDRPGFVSLRRRAIQNRNISHILIHKSDRFARPEQAVQAMAMETELLHAGLTIVFSNRTSEPRERGIHYFERDILLLHEYSQNGEFLTQLAERVLAAQIRLAKGGYWTGGPAPYGFVRVLCDAAGNEIMVLDEKTTIRREGCHVRIRVDEQNPARIETWLSLLKWYGVDGWGVQRIANRLNELRIPSPNAGRTRVIGGVLRPNSGKWCKKTVKRLIENQAIIGMAVFGVRSEGAHRRFSPDGPRTLTESDRTEEDRARNIFNAKDQLIVVKTGYEPAASVDLFESCQEQREMRGRSQRGVSKSDPATYPLSTRIYDRSGDCNATFYGVKENGKRWYMCSAYSESKGRECFRHAIDADIALRYTINTLKQQLIAAGGRKALRSRLEALAAEDEADSCDVAMDELTMIEKRCASLQAEAETTLTNMSRAKTGAAFSALEKRYEATLADIEKLESETEILRTRKTVGTDGKHRAVEDALGLYDEIDRITSDENARADINSVLKQLNFQMGLRYIENPRCKRPKRILVGGRLTLGDNPRRGHNSHGSGDHPLDMDGDGQDSESDPSGCSHPTPAAHVVQQADRSMGKGAGGECSEPPEKDNETEFQMSMDYGEGEFTDAATMRGRDWPALTQFCVIIENRVGSLNQLMQHLERHDVRIIALSIVDTIDVAIARVMLDQVERGRELFELSGFTFFENEVLGIELPDHPQPFVAVLSTLLQAEVNVNYMYPLLYRHEGHSSIAVHVEDLDTATKVLREKGFDLISESDLMNDDEHFG